MMFYHCKACDYYTVLQRHHEVGPHPTWLTCNDCQRAIRIRQLSYLPGDSQLMRMQYDHGVGTDLLQVVLELTAAKKSSPVEVVTEDGEQEWVV